jgi:2-C-methyl-D-erythritol 4-phosphate cytidylyltransferase
MTATAVIAAGGSGKRFGLKTPKQFLPIHGIPMIFHTLRAFERASSIDRIIAVLPEEDLARLNEKELRKYGITKIVCAVKGGDTRQASVGNGLEAVEGNPDFVAIHDAARCLVTPELIDRTVAACEAWDGAIASLPVRDTLKLVDGEHILRTEPREQLWGMQTPQVFRYTFIRDAYRKAATEGFAATDDAAVAEHAGGRVRVVKGATQNLKITYPEDLRIAERILEDKE